MSAQTKTDPSEAYRRVVMAALGASAIVHPSTPESDLATLRACGLWPWSDNEVTWWCDGCKSRGCAACASGALKPSRTQLVTVAGIGAHDLRRAVAIAGRFGATRVVTLRVMSEGRLRGLGGLTDGHRPPEWFSPEQREDWPFWREMAQIGAHFFGVHRDGAHHGNVILAVVDYDAAAPERDAWSSMAGVVDGARWRKAVTEHGQAALFDAIEEVAALADMRELSGNALSAIGHLFARAIRRRLLLASLEHHRWDMPMVAEDFRMGGGTSNVLREIKDVGLLKEIERARRDGLVRRGKHRGLRKRRGAAGGGS